MKRQIMFRGKTTVQNSQWIYGSLVRKENLDLIGGYEITAPTHSDPCGDTIWTQELVIRQSVGEFTGKKDKNGNHIFEKDFVKGYFYAGIGQPFRGTFEVIYSDIWCSFGVEIDAMFVGIGNAEIEVVGNRFENPEMLGS